MNKFKMLLEKLSNFLILASVFGLILMTVIIGWQVFGRFVLNSSPSWSEQAALFLMVWYVTLAAASGVREGFHIRILILQTWLAPQNRRRVQILVSLIVGLCGLAMLYGGVQLVGKTWSHTISSLGIPRGLAYLGLPISGALIMLFSLENILSNDETDDQNVENL